MNITKIASWLDSRYNVKSAILKERLIMRAVCGEDVQDGRIDPERTICILDHEDLTTRRLNESGNYIIIGADITEVSPRSNNLIISRDGVDPHVLCRELNDYISGTVKTNDRLAKLNQYLLGDDFMEHMLDFFFEEFQNPIMYVDYSHYVISYRQNGRLNIDIWDNAVKYGHYDPDLIDDTFKATVDAVVRTQGAHCMKLQGFDYFIWGIKNENTLYGFFAMITTGRPMTADEMSIMSTAASLTALKLGNHNYVAGKGDYSEIIMDLLSEKIKTEHELAFRMLTRNWKKSAHYQIFLIDLRGKGEKYNSYIKNGLEAISNKIKHVTYEEFELIMLDDSSFGEMNIITNYAMQYKLISGLSDVFPSLLEIRTYFEQGKKAIMFGSQFGGEADKPFMYSDYRFYDFLSDCANMIDCSKYYHPITADLELYDVKHKTELFNTLLTYLECGKSIQRTCKKMYLHKNTVNYRIQRIKQLFDIDYDDGKTVHYIYLSLKLHTVNRVNAVNLLNTEAEK